MGFRYFRECPAPWVIMQFTLFAQYYVCEIYACYYSSNSFIFTAAQIPLNGGFPSPCSYSWTSIFCFSAILKSAATNIFVWFLLCTRASTVPKGSLYQWNCWSWTMPLSISAGYCQWRPKRGIQFASLPGVWELTLLQALAHPWQSVSLLLIRWVERWQFQIVSMRISVITGDV